MDRCPDELVALALRLADAAGAVARRYFRTPVAVDAKADATPVTVADREAETAIRAILAAERPDDGIIGEEHGSERRDSRFVWVLDPIDGTRSFIVGRPIFGTLIALFHDGVPVLGVIDQPVIGDRWVGATGHPTLLNGQPCRTRPCPDLSRALLAATAPEMFGADEFPRFDALRRQAKSMVYGGDCYNYGLLAAGFLDLVVESNMAPHDWAALVPVIQGAGGIITDWDGAALTLASSGRILAAGDPALHAQAKAVLMG